MNYPLYILLDVHDSLEKLGTMGDTSRTGIIYVIYINSDYKHLGYIIYTTILENHMQATLDSLIGENQSAAIKNNNITCIFHNSTCNWRFDIS